ncbi:hypothetical protein [Muricoccus vinaceus]|uniref:Uncharacterized protein n=1 Tax=Muricoccus vinaceus TaxID=424704 RepID=A0ABV6IVJ0_9PROT
MSGGPQSSDWREPARPVRDGTGVTAVDLCDFTDRTPLASPNPPVIRSLSVGDLLSIILVKGPPTVVEARNGQGQTAGSITSTMLAQLTECLQGGRQYVAEVISIHGGTCIVEVRPK